MCCFSLFNPGKIIILTLFAGLLLSACADERAHPESIRIGLIVYINPDLEQLMGIPTRNAAQMAVNEANAGGGIRIGDRSLPLELIIKAINSNPQEAVAATRKLTNRDGVIAIVGPQNSSDAIPAGDFAEKARVPLISPMSTNRRTTEGRDYVYRMSFVDDFQGAVMARFARIDLQAQTAAVLRDAADPYSRGVAKVFMATFSRLGGVVTTDEHFLSGATDFQTQLQRIQQSAPDVLLLPNFAETARQQVLQARKLGINAHLLGCDGWDATRLSSLPEFDGAFMSTHWSHDLDSDVSRAFAQRYRENFNEEPEAPAALTYDAINLLIRAIGESQSTESTDLREAINALGPTVGVTGSVDFSNSGNPDKAVVILQFAERQDRFVKQVAPKP